MFDIQKVYKGRPKLGGEFGVSVGNDVCKKTVQFLDFSKEYSGEVLGRDSCREWDEVEHFCKTVYDYPDLCVPLGFRELGNEVYKNESP